MWKSIKEKVRTILNWDQRKFDKICNKEDLKLDFDLNKDAIRVLETIFLEKEYLFDIPSDKDLIILDVGAHYGYFTIFAQRQLSKFSKIYSIEPSTKNIKVLRENFRANTIEDTNVFNCGLAAKTEIRPFFGGASYNHSIISNQSEAMEHVSVYSLEDFISLNKIETIDFLKMDVEGAEYEILLNSNSETLQKIEMISLEFHDLRSEGYKPEMLKEYLITAGFKLLKFEYEKDYSNTGLQFGKMIFGKN